MLSYIIRRVLYMIPTVFGVIVITFILFNVVGGSPAAMTLGKNVSPRALEEFDEQRGFNKPLFFGNWTKTRAYADAGFRENAGPWRTVAGVSYVKPGGGTPGHITLAPGPSYALPLAFALKPGTTYQWIFRYRLPAGQAVIRDSNQVAQAAVTGLPVTLPAAAAWRTLAVTFTVTTHAAAFKPALQVTGEGLELSGLQLRRQTAHPFDSQFLFYLGQIVRLDFGKSTYTNQRVSQMLADGIGPSLSLTAPIFAAGLAVAISIALICAFFRNTWLDRGIVVIAVVLMSLNYLVWIIFGQYFLAYREGWFPIWGYESWSYLLLPVLIGVVSGLGTDVRFYRTIMLDEMYRDYVRTAFAKGVSRSGVLFRHVLKNAMIPILTNVVIAIPFLYTGSLLLEQFFGIPGLGNMGLNAINYSDVDVVRAIVLIGAVLYVIANLLTDLCYAFVDPRVRLE